MTAGDFTTVDGDVSNSSTVDILPSADLEVWRLNEIGVTGAFELYALIGGTAVLLKSYPQGELLRNLSLQVHKTSGYRIKNVSGGSLKYTYKYGVLK